MQGRVLIRREPSEEGTLRISDVETSAEWLTVSARRLDGPEPRGGGLPAGQSGDWVIEVGFRDDPVFGRHRESVTFQTSLPREPEVTLPIDIVLEAPVHLSTGRLRLGTVAPGKAGGKVFAYVRKGLDPSRLEVEAGPDPLRVEVTRSGTSMFTVNVSWEGGRLSDGGIEFRVGEESIRLPVEWNAVPTR